MQAQLLITYGVVNATPWPLCHATSTHTVTPAAGLRVFQGYLFTSALTLISKAAFWGKYTGKP